MPCLCGPIGCYDNYMPHRGKAQQALVHLVRQSSLARRWPVVLSEDFAALDEITGSRQATLKLMRDLVDAGNLQRVRRGAYILRDEAGVLNVDLFQLVDTLTSPPYLITAGRALSAHGLSDQHFRHVVVLVSAARRSFEWRGDQVHYAVVKRSRLWGWQRSHGPHVAVPERALLDSVARREWGVSLSQSVEALDISLARWPDFAASLASASARYRNAAVSRRLGFLVSRIVGDEKATPFRSLLGPSKSATLLDSLGASEGPVDSRWGIRINAELDDLLAHRVVG